MFKIIKKSGYRFVCSFDFDRPGPVLVVSRIGNAGPESRRHCRRQALRHLQPGRESDRRNPAKGPPQ